MDPQRFNLPVPEPGDDILNMKKIIRRCISELEVMLFSIHDFDVKFRYPFDGAIKLRNKLEHIEPSKTNVNSLADATSAAKMVDAAIKSMGRKSAEADVIHSLFDAVHAASKSKEKINEKTILLTSLLEELTKIKKGMKKGDRIPEPKKQKEEEPKPVDLNTLASKEYNEYARQVRGYVSDISPGIQGIKEDNKEKVSNILSDIFSMLLKTISMFDYPPITKFNLFNTKNPSNLTGWIKTISEISVSEIKPGTDLKVIFQTIENSRKKTSKLFDEIFGYLDYRTQEARERNASYRKLATRYKKTISKGE